MTDELRTTLAELPTPERAAIAQYLLSTLDDEDDPGAAEGWDAELAQRGAAIEAGKAVGEPAAKVFAELREKHRSNRPISSLRRERSWTLQLPGTIEKARDLASRFYWR